MVDLDDLDQLLAPVEEPRESYAPANQADLLRMRIASDPARHGAWLQLTQYEPLPKRIAQGIAASWRRARPERFGGARHFEARIMPTLNGRAHRTLAVTKATLFAVAVRYPGTPELTADTSPVLVIRPSSDQEPAEPAVCIFGDIEEPAPGSSQAAAVLDPWALYDADAAVEAWVDDASHPRT